MPYKVFKTIVKGDERPWKIKNLKTGKVVGTSKTQLDAEKSIGARFVREK